MLETKRHSRKPYQWWIDGLAIAVVFLLMGFVVGRGLNWGNIPFDFLDWSQEGPRYLFLQQALAKGQLPLFIESPMIETERFLGVPDTLLVPQLVALPHLSLGKFILLNALLNYCVGFYLLLRLKRRLGWSLAPFLVTAPLALLNGFIIGHLNVGHTMWVNAFLLPWFILLILELPKQGIDWRWILNFSLYSLVLFLQGGFHFALWSWAFLLICGVLKNISLKTVLLSILFSILAAMVRILPASITYFDNDRRFIAGFRTLNDLVQSLIHLQLPEEAQDLMNSGLPNWETNFYIGLVGGGLILVFAIAIPLYQKEKQRWFAHLWIPLIIFSVLSIGQIFRFTNLLPFGWAHAERVSSRFFIIPLLFLIVIGGDTFNQWWQALKGRSLYWLVFLAIEVILLHDLIQHARLWRLDRLRTIFETTSIPLIAEVVSRSDPPYIRALIVGGSVSILSVLLLIILNLLNKKKAPREPNRPGAE